MPAVTERVLTAQQQMRLERTLRLFGCADDDYVIQWAPFDLPEGWVYVTIGTRKGRPFVFGVAPDGSSAS